jgi:eukaryotic-like serine/threonine-protein kinase
MTPGETGKITDERWERVQELFSRAVELPEAERDAFITREAGSDAELRKELVELLACDTGVSTGPLTQALGAALDATTRDRRKALLGRKVGNYKLVSVLGHGGTGTVYLGERADRQYSAQVAIKIVDSATVQGELGMRFRAERQILASLNHTNIARLLDAGETEEGQPYLVMEYVHGEPLDRYCDRHQLDLRGRLRLFLDICSAVQYAHQNLVVHRDLKPANILVTSEGAPKLLDFGIAKLLDTGEAAAALALTRMNDRLLTPEYASPEQIMGRPVTTASDVYALGIVLYELLTGLRPYTVPASASQLELERSICISDPQRPSSAVRRAIESGPLEGQSEMLAIAMARGISAEKLQRRLVGDVDAIVMRALRKEPQHRYGSVEQLAADVRRHLTQEPVHARQGTWFYYSQRFIRRHAFGVAAAGAFAVFIIAFAVAMSVQTRRVAAERDRAEQESQVAEQVSGFMMNVFSAADPYDNQGKEITAKQLLERAGTGLREDVNQRPEVRARLLEAIGRAHRRRGEVEKSISYLEDAVRIRKQSPDADGSALLTATAELALTLLQAGDADTAESMLERSIRTAEARGLQRTPMYAFLLTNRGRLRLNSNRLVEARRDFEQSLELNRELLGPTSNEVAVVLLELSRVFQWSDDLKAAERVTRQAVEVVSSLPSMNPERVLAEARLGEVLYLENRINDAAPLFLESLRKQTQLFGENSKQVADTLDSLARIRSAQGLFEEAEEFARRAIAAHAVARGDKHTDTAYYRTALAAVLMRRAKYAEADEELRRALDTFSSTLPPDHQYVASAEHLLGETLVQRNQLEAAESVFRAAMNRWKRTSAPEWRVAASASGLGESLYRQGRVDEAEKYLVESYRTLARNENAYLEMRAKARQRIVRFYTDRGQPHKLEELMLATSDDNSVPPTARAN